MLKIRLFGLVKSRIFINIFYDIEKTTENIIIVYHEGWLSMFFAYYLGLDLNLHDKTYISGKSGGVSILEEDS